MTTRWVVLSDRARPTEDIYFSASAAPGLRAAGIDVQWIDVHRWRLAPGPAVQSVWRGLRGAHLLVCRSLPSAWIDRLAEKRCDFGRIVYLVDDDLHAAADDAQLPPAYAERMATVALEQQPRLLGLADTLVVASRALAAAYAEAHADVRLLEPPLIAEPPDTRHFDNGDSWRVGFHGTRAHADDLAGIARALTHLSGERDDVLFEVMLGRHTPAALREHARVDCPAPRPWHHFKPLLGTPHLHIGLAPLMDRPLTKGSLGSSSSISPPWAAWAFLAIVPPIPRLSRTVRMRCSRTMIPLLGTAVSSGYWLHRMKRGAWLRARRTRRGGSGIWTGRCDFGRTCRERLNPQRARAGRRRLQVVAKGVGLALAGGEYRLGP